MQDNREKSALSRRAFVGRLAAGAAGAAVVMAGSAGRAGAVARRGEAATQPGAVQSANGAVQSASGAVQEGPESVREPSGLASGPPPWELLVPLRAGAVVAGGWRVAELSGVVDGSCVLTLANERGRTHRVHVCRNDGRPQGLVYTEGLDLVVMNGGRGDLPTEEGLAQAVAKVGRVVAANERRQAAVVAELLPQAERVRRFGEAARLR